MVGSGTFLVVRLLRIWLPANAGNTGSISGLWKFHVMGQLSLHHKYWIRAPKAWAPQEKPPQWEACAPQLESSPHSPQLEKACAQQWRPSTVKIQTNKLKKIFFKMVGSVLYAVLSCSVVSDSLQPHGLQPARLVCPLGFSRQEYWSGVPWPRSPALWAASLQR